MRVSVGVAVTHWFSLPLHHGGRIQGNTIHPLLHTLGYRSRRIVSNAPYPPHLCFLAYPPYPFFWMGVGSYYPLLQLNFVARAFAVTIGTKLVPNYPLC